MKRLVALVPALFLTGCINWVTHQPQRVNVGADTDAAWTRAVREVTAIGYTIETKDRASGTIVTTWATYPRVEQYLMRVRIHIEDNEAEVVVQCKHDTLGGDCNGRVPEKEWERVRQLADAISARPAAR